MINVDMDYCEAGKDRLLSRRVIVKFIYIMLYFSIYVINYRIVRANAHFNPQAEVKEENKKEEKVEEKLSLVRPMEEDQVEEDQVEEDQVEEDQVEDDQVAKESVLNLDDSMETICFYDFEGTGEQLRRLRAYNPKVDGETDEQYEKRIWDMAYEEDAEEERQRSEKAMVANEVVLSTNEIVEEVVPLEKDANTWHTTEDGKCRYKGEWKNGLPNGKGIKHFYKTDSYIDGNFVDGFADGFCKQTFEQTWEKTQPYYEGEFKRNNYNGKGAYYYGNGDYYKGMWKDGNYHGQGASYRLILDRTWVGEYKNDEKVEGNWVRGEI
jgi:hypothetical protein